MQRGCEGEEGRPSREGQERGFCAEVSGESWTGTVYSPHVLSDILGSIVSYGVCNVLTFWDVRTKPRYEDLSNVSDLVTPSEFPVLPEEHLDQHPRHLSQGEVIPC
jgi:hypothetical protein